MSFQGSDGAAAWDKGGAGVRNKWAARMDSTTAPPT
jgi:hypothetical protein